MTYLVECYSPGDPVRLADAVLAEGFDGAEVRCVGCLAVPADDAGLFVFESRSLPELERGLTALGLEYERIVEVIRCCRSESRG
jgi:hypothetical protein